MPVSSAVATVGLAALSVAFACAVPPARAQGSPAASGEPAPFSEVSYRQIGTAEGLPSATVYSLLEDDDGWIWVGTAAGLYRYDGVDFVRYGSPLARQPDIHNLLRGPGGRIYGQNFRGQVFCVSADSLELVGDFYRRHPRFVSYAFAGERIAVAAAEAVLLYGTQAGEWPIDVDAAGDTALIAEAPEIHAVGLHGGLVQGDVPAGQVTFGSIGPSATPLLPDSRFGTRRQGDSTWVTQVQSRGGRRLVQVSCVDEGGRVRAYTHFELPSEVAYRGNLFAQRHPDGRFLISTVRGLLLVTLGPGGVSAASSTLNVLPGATSSALLVDRAGRAWVGTSDRGLLLVPDLDQRQRDYPTVHAPLTELTTAGSDGALLGLTFDGSLYELTASPQRLTTGGPSSSFWRGRGDTLYIGNTRIHPAPHPKFREALLNELGAFKGGTVLPDGSLALATSARAAVVRAYSDARALEATVAHPIIEEYRPAQMRGYRRPPQATIRNRRATDVAFDSLRNRLYVAYNDRLLIYDLSTGEVAEPIAARELGGRALRLLLDGRRLLVARAGTGLVVAELDEADVVTDLEAYLPGVSVERVRATAAYFWAETDGGVYRARRDRRPLSFEAFDVRFGLPAGKPTAFHVDDDYAYAAFDRRVIRVAADAPPRVAAARAIRFAVTERAGEPLPDANVQPLAVEASRQSLRFQPRLPEYSQAPRTTFEYRLSGGDTAWRTAPAEGAIFLEALPEGRHALEVRLAGESGTATEWVIDARVPFWRKPWPYVLLTLLLAAVVIQWVRRRARVRQRRAERETALRESQLSALAAQMNPHFVFNALNSVQDFMMDNDRLAANDYLTKFARLIRLTLEHSRRPEIKLSEELDVMRTFLDLERVRFDGEIDIALEASPDLRLSAKLPALVVQPYVENAFKHGLLHRRGERRLRVAYEPVDEDGLRVTVEDNGVGRVRAAELRSRARVGTNFSSGATARRIALLNEASPGSYRVTIEDLRRDGEAAGTRVTISLRLSPPDPKAPAHSSPPTHA